MQVDPLYNGDSIDRATLMLLDALSAAEIIYRLGLAKLEAEGAITGGYSGTSSAVPSIFYSPRISFPLGTDWPRGKLGHSSPGRLLTCISMPGSTKK